MGGSASKASSAIKQAARRAPAGAPAAVVPSQAPPPPATAPDVTPDAIAFPDELLQRERARPGKLRDPSRDEVAGRTGAALAGQRAASASNRHPVGQGEMLDVVIVFFPASISLANFKARCKRAWPREGGWRPGDRPRGEESTACISPAFPGAWLMRKSLCPGY